MINLIKKMLGLGPKVDFAEMRRQGAVIIDVRSAAEYSGGHINGSKNIPLDKLKASLGSLTDKNATIITCCASGMRSGMAKSVLKAEGYQHVYNGGGWASLKAKLNH